MPQTSTILNFYDEKLAGILLDIVFERKTTRTSTITAHPVEKGVTISDFSIQENVVITFRAEISNSNFFEVSPEDHPFGERANRAYEELVNIYENRIVFDYQTGFELFQNMLITMLDVIEVNGKPNALVADFVIEQINFVATQQIEYSANVLTDKASKQLQSTIHRGLQSLEDFPPDISVVNTAPRGGV